MGYGRRHDARGLFSGSTTAFIALTVTAVLMVGLANGVAAKLTRAGRQPQGDYVAGPVRRPRFPRTGGQRLVMHGLLWVVLWMAIGGALTVALIPLYPDWLLERVAQLQTWVAKREIDALVLRLYR